MVAYKMDLKIIFKEELTQNIFISNMDNPAIAWDEVQRARCSANTNTANKYKNGNFLNTLGQLMLMSQLKFQRHLPRISREREQESTSIHREI